MRLPLTLIIAGCALVAASGQARDKERKDEDDAARKAVALLQGSWEIVGKEFMGKKADKKELDELKGKMVVKENKVTQWGEESGKKEVVSEATWKADPKAKPRALDVTYTNTILKGKTVLAIYELKGDTLRVCYALEGEDRPTEFAGKADGKAFLLTYQRVKK
jgi:uncharacterized protein (TIGR03067 family)